VVAVVVGGERVAVQAGWAAQEQAALTAFRMQNVFNMPVTVYSLSDFVSTVITKILNPKVADPAGAWLSMRSPHSRSRRRFRKAS
jgi:hypothetical protein